MRREFSILWTTLCGGLLMISSAFAEPVRVTTWNLRPNIAGGTNEWSPKVRSGQIEEAADALKKLKPDVIVLQQVADWKTCDDLAQALRPEEYQVVVCSAFRDPRTKTPRRQVAILAHAKAYISWSEPWRTNGAPGGFAFAAIHLGSKNAGIFSVQLSDDKDDDLRGSSEQTMREESVRQLIKQIASLQNWTTNKLDALVVAGDFNATMDDADTSREKTLSMLAGFGFENALAHLPREQRVTLPGNRERPDATVDYLFTRKASQVTAPQFFQVALSEHSAVTSDLDFGSSPLIVRTPTPATPPPPAPMTQVAAKELDPVVSTPTPIKAPAPPVTIASTSASPTLPQWSWLAAGILAGGMVLFIVIRARSRRMRRPLALPNHPPFVHIAIDGGAQTQLQVMSAPREASVPEDVRAGVVAQLTHWFKERFVQRLVADRAQLLENQQAAALKVLAVDERLAKIERQIQERNQEYERRIDALIEELANAHEENRELIRAKIALVKAEMEKARAKAEDYMKSGQHD